VNHEIQDIDDPRVIEKILRHLGAWHDSPTRPPPQFRTNRPAKGRRQAKLPVEAPPSLWQCRATLGEPKNQFSLTRAALSTGGRAKSKFLLSVGSC
jgi:predicted Zn-dependent peptidase